MSMFAFLKFRASQQRFSLTKTSLLQKSPSRSSNVVGTARVVGGAIVFSLLDFFGVFFDGCEVDGVDTMGFIETCLM